MLTWLWCVSVISAGCCSHGSPSICMGTESPSTSRTSLAWPTRCGSPSPTCICAMWKLEKTQNTSSLPSLTKDIILILFNH